MSCEGAYSTSDEFAEYWCISLTGDDGARLNRNLRLAATRIHAARAANDQCDCTLAGWATDYLKELNILIAVTVYNCKCTNLHLDTDDKRAYLEAVQNDLALIREGKLELCAGETGMEYPYITWAERSLTPFNVEQIIRNEVLRRGS